jgi:hypothetical protein
MRSRLAVLALVLAPALGCGKIMTFLKGGPHDAGPVPELVDEPIPAPPEGDAAVPNEELAKLLADPDDDDEDEDGGCPQPLVPGYCRRRCKTFGERKSTGHARRVWPSAAYAFGTCGRYDVFAELSPDGGGIVEYYEDGALIGAKDDRRACGRYGKIPACRPVLVWKDAGVGFRGPSVKGGTPMIFE